MSGFTQQAPRATEDINVELIEKTVLGERFWPGCRSCSMAIG
jgi:hypothetical protein